MTVDGFSKIAYQNYTLSTHSMIDVDKPLKKGFFIPFDSSTNVRSCLLSGHKPLSENIDFLVSNSQRAQTLLE